MPIDGMSLIREPPKGVVGLQNGTSYFELQGWITDVELSHRSVQASIRGTGFSYRLNPVFEHGTGCVSGGNRAPAAPAAQLCSRLSKALTRSRMRGKSPLISGLLYIRKYVPEIPTKFHLHFDEK